MGTLYIDDQPVEFQPGDNVLDAAQRANIEVPYFCYHPALGAVGSCRVCAMETVPSREGEQPRTVMTCTLKAQDGMRFKFAQSDKAPGVSKTMVEFYMTRHPNDCPVCDEGGDCHLQNMTVEVGHAYRRFDGQKKTYPNQQLGPLVWNTANRCITCYRCVRFYQDYALGNDFGAMGSRNNVLFRRIDDGAFDSPFAGNIITVCPTGTFTDKVFRRKYSRTWMLKKSSSICGHCSVGCHVEPGARAGSLRRIVPEENGAVNAHFICDRGRYAPHASEATDRPLQVLVGGQPREGKPFDVLKEAMNVSGVRWGVLGSGREDLVTNLTLAQLADSLKAPFSAFGDGVVEGRVKTAVNLSGNAPSLRDIEAADCIVVVGELTEHAPMMELAVRQALKGGVPVLMIHAAPSLLAELTRTQPSLSAQRQTPSRWADLLQKLISELPSAEANSWSALLKNAANPVLLGVAELMPVTAIKALGELAAAMGENTKLGFALPEANSAGVARISPAGSADALLEAVEQGQVNALLVVGHDPMSGWQGARWSAALKQVQHLIVVDHIHSATVQAATVVIPSAAVSERNGLFINYEGRVQNFAKAYTRNETVLLQDELVNLLDSTARSAMQSQLQSLMPASKDARLPAPGLTIASRLPLVPGDSTSLVLSAWHGEDEVALYSKELASLLPHDEVAIHPDYARSLGLTLDKHSRLTLSSNGKQLTLPVRLVKFMAEGCVGISRRAFGELASRPGLGITLTQAMKLAEADSVTDPAVQQFTPGTSSHGGASL
ncbi:molybdopterin-dependent oxidoreductase [Pokkaliibacter sp. CJK22405]|uniref:molybdopterin-dependent oxidoreductase n=1 Tax=Pokkaliibacter sp. CJK22405 TaxID=3384615 RepID=UPI003984CA33